MKQIHVAQMFKYSEKCDHNTLLALNMLGIVVTKLTLTALRKLAKNEKEKEGATNCNLRLTRRHESSSFIISSNHASQSRHMTESIITLRNREVQNNLL
ncbi:hypothetical protein T11_7502 [Trichinella zimbabwensis]|uniref:Uncharacterized protein n=1 Tax=Trichinella zimbabwensis TaxID=268475 RepID=A0A0V1HM32_9BILA|nr:hypothetical protein T11_7502 [Trichinella zimbabwensis]